MANKLPQLSELTLDTTNAYKGDQLNKFLNHSPKPEWVKEHPYVKGHKYIPIGVIEMLLKMIFKQHRIEITGQGTSFNGVWVTVRVHYMNPVTGEWNFHDGIGAIQLQTKSGSTPADLANINNGALSMAFPHAKTLAIKDACDSFGKLFGSDLNRKDTLAYTSDESIEKKMLERVNKVLDGCETVEQVEEAKKTIPEHYHELADELINYIKEKDEDS